MYCNVCGKNNPKDSKFCQHCGIKFNQHPVSKPSEHKSSHVGAWIVGIIIVVIVAFFIHEVLFSSSNTNSSNNLPTINTGTSIMDSFKTSYQSSFIKSCENSGGGAASSDAICTCVANYLVTHYSDNQLTNITVKYKLTGKTPQEMTVAVGSCISPNSNTSDQTALEITYGNNFMNSCNSEGNLYNQCSCLLTYLRNNYTLTQRAQMDLDYNRTKQLPQAMIDAAKICTTSNSNQ